MDSRKLLAAGCSYKGPVLAASPTALHCSLTLCRYYGSERRATIYAIRSEDEIDLLRKKLDLMRFPDELENAGWDNRVTFSDIQRLVEHWVTGFGWRKAEAGVNKMPMFTRDVDVHGFGTLNIHYVHQKSEVTQAIPLLFVHGCDFLEVRKMLPSLTQKSANVSMLSRPAFLASGSLTRPKCMGSRRRTAPQQADVVFGI
ncbi:alpha/beta-hydrolase [Trametes coccinea BRFM310]|uniref:Alpha/beta-hydrolase n=1 Tax=Trametes coccinea (strain BRFM310) TaxID=1353009 RepID=A0A1Y2IP60_TRAC3|nr:alpha/beta-hydrolase [Trametes coccinea BRFM310]